MYETLIVKQDILHSVVAFTILSIVTKFNCYNGCLRSIPPFKAVLWSRRWRLKKHVSHWQRGATPHFLFCVFALFKIPFHNCVLMSHHQAESRVISVRHGCVLMRALPPDIWWCLEAEWWWWVIFLISTHSVVILIWSNTRTSVYFAGTVRAQCRSWCEECYSTQKSEDSLKINLSE